MQCAPGSPCADPQVSAVMYEPEVSVLAVWCWTSHFEAKHTSKCMRLRGLSLQLKMLFLMSTRIQVNSVCVATGTQRYKNWNTPKCALSTVFILALPAAGFLSETPWAGWSCPCRMWPRGFRPCWTTWRGRHLCGGWLSARGSLWPAQDSPDSRSSPADVKQTKSSVSFSLRASNPGSHVHTVSVLGSSQFAEPCVITAIWNDFQLVSISYWVPGLCQ